VFCPGIVVLGNTSVHYNAQSADGLYPFDTVAYFNCSEGFGIDGLSSAVCTADGLFEPASPVCACKFGVACMLLMYDYASE